MEQAIYLVRHGQTYFNRYNRMQGWSDSPLTEKGKADATAAGKKLAQIPFTHAFCSDTTRAMNTAREILALNTAGLAELEISSHFREQFYGYYEGEDSPKTWYMIGFPHGAATFKEIVNQFSLDESKDFMKAADPFHDAENAAEYWARLGQGFEQLKAVANTQPGPILVVSHGTTIRSIVGRYSNEFDVSVSPLNGSVSKLLLTPDGFKVSYYNKLELPE